MQKEIYYGRVMISEWTNNFFHRENFLPGMNALFGEKLTTIYFHEERWSQFRGPCHAIFFDEASGVVIDYDYFSPPSGHAKVTLHGNDPAKMSDIEKRILAQEPKPLLLVETPTV